MDHTPNRGMQTLMHSQQRYQRNEDVLRGLENGTIHLMTLDPPGQIHKDQEFIDHVTKTLHDHKTFYFNAQFLFVDAAQSPIRGNKSCCRNGRCKLSW